MRQPSRSVTTREREVPRHIITGIKRSASWITGSFIVTLPVLLSLFVCVRQICAAPGLVKGNRYLADVKAMKNRVRNKLERNQWTEPIGKFL
jgi:hypothetical protein